MPPPMAPAPESSDNDQPLSSTWTAYYRKCTWYMLCLLPFRYIALLLGCVVLSALDIQLMSHWAAFCSNAIKVMFFIELVVYIFGPILASSSTRYPGIPLLREPEGATSFSLRTRLAYYTDAKNLFSEAYEKYSKHGKTCIVPSLGLRKEVIVPPTSLRWITSQGDHILNGPEAVIDMNAFDWTTGHRNYFLDPWQGMLIRRDMNAVLENLAVALNDELQVCFDEFLGTSTTEWMELKIYETVQLCVAQASSRFTVGLPLCRNKDYLHHNITLHNLYLYIGAMIGIMPTFVRGLIAPILSLPCRYYQWRIDRVLSPLFTERMKYLESPPKENPKEPQDHFQMILRFAQKERPSELNLHDIGVRAVIANLGSFHQTGLAATNLLLNVLDSDKEYNTISVLRAEITEVLRDSSGLWTRAAAAKMVRCDSVLRETLRLHGFNLRHLLRKVMADDITTEDGFILPKGTDVSLMSFSMHTNAEIFDDPLKFNPFRFSDIREDHGNNNADSTKAPNVSFVSTGPNFLPFSHGKHVCPGRFIVDFELKMVLAHVLLHYDMEFPEEYDGKRPSGKYMAEILMPPENAKIRFRRRG